MNEKIKILYLSASPNDQEKLSVDEEFRSLYEKIDRNSYEMISVSGAQASDFQSIVLENDPEIIHFSGHASSDEVLFENAASGSQGVPKNAIVNFFHDLDEKPRLIFFNACRTAENLEILSEIIDFIVATERPVFDDTAVIFATKFYQFLSLGKSVGTAFKLARNEFNISPTHGRETREASMNYTASQSGNADSKNEAEMYRLFIREGADDKAFVRKDERKENHEGINIETYNVFKKNKIESITFNNKKS
jgi:hypothetical protein